jgi:hypothetical protein
MKAFLSSLAVALLAAAPVSADSDPRVLLEKAHKEGTPKTLQSTMAMSLRDSRGRSQDRTLEIRKIEDEKQLVWFVTPADLRGTAFLRLGSSSDRRMWLYLPAFKRTERISGSKENESFLGSDFTYADMAERDLDLYHHKYLGQAELNGEKVHRIESTIKDEDGDELYSKILSFVSVDGNRLLQEDLYDMAGKLFKRKTQEQFEQVQNYRMPKVVTMTDLARNHSTRIEMRNVKVDEPLADNMFSTQYMQRIRP